MATAKIPEIKEFPRDGRFWRVDWKGAVLPNPSISTEPFFQIVISPFFEDPSGCSGKHLASVHQTDLSQQKVIHIGVGQLPLIPTGSIWRDGLCQDTFAGKNSAFRSLFISSKTTQIITAVHKENGKNIIPYNAYRIGKAGVGSKLVAVERNGDAFGILIPVMELVRFYYAVSTNIAHALFSGAFQHNLDTLINVERSYYDAEEDRVVLGLRQHVTDEEGWVIARILRSKEAGGACRQIYNGVLKDAINRGFTHIESGFPFTGATDIKARVKWIRQAENSPWRCLVLSLEHCTALLPYSQLTVIRDNDGSGAKGGTDLPDSEKKEYRRGKGYFNKEVKEPLLQSERDSNAGLSNVVLTVPSNRFGPLEGRIPDKPTKEQCEFRSADLLAKGSSIEALGTGVGGYGEDEEMIQRANISPQRERKKAARPSFDTFIAAVEQLNQYDDISASIRQASTALGYMPLTKPSKNWQWAYLDSAKKIRRSVIIADIFCHGKFFHLIEFELRNSDSCTVALLSTGIRRLSDGELFHILFRCALENGVWKNTDSDELDVEIISLKHTWDSYISFSESVSDRLEGL